MGKRTVKGYVPENLALLAKALERVRENRDGKGCLFRVNLDALQRAIQNLPQENKEAIERYWGLTGGTNHSKKTITSNNVALQNMQDTAVASIKLLLKLDYTFIYDEHMKAVVQQLAKKINKNGIQISDVDAVKYLLVFAVILQNGPKMCFERDELSIATGCNPRFEFDEYSVVSAISEQFKNYHANYIQLGFLVNWLDMLDFRDKLAILKKFGIPISKSDLKIITKESVDLEVLDTFAQIRDFKERVFPFGDWQTTCALVFGGNEGESELELFIGEIDALPKDWSKIEKFKVGQKKLQTAHELRTLDVYEIGGLKFTDSYEVMFLCLMRNLILPPKSPID